jgi:nitrite reductase/ring-hydroxylating ferredoxin subunit
MASFALVISEAEESRLLPDRTLAQLTPSRARAPGLCVAKLDDLLCALANRCPHCGTRLSARTLYKAAVTCWLHGLASNLCARQRSDGLAVRTMPYIISVSGNQIHVSRDGRAWLRPPKNRASALREAA